MPVAARSPRTIAELIEQYDRFITGCIFKISKGHVRPDDIDDLRQQILLRVHERQYLKKYNPSKGAFNTYLYWLIRSVVVNQFESNQRNPLNTAIPVIESLGVGTHLDGEEVQGALVLEAYRDAVDDSFERIACAKDLADRFERHLTTLRPWGAAIPLPGGLTERRSLALVFRLLRQSLEVKDIATALQCSPGSVFGYLKRIRLEARKFAAVLTPAV